MIFTIRIQRFALLLRKNRSTDLHRFLPYGIFLDMKTREHDLFSRRLFSPTNYTNFTPLFSLKRLFLPQITQITRIHFSFFSIRSLTASNALYGFAQIFALRHLFFLDMKTREHDFFSLRLFSPTDYTDNTDFCLRI